MSAKGAPHDNFFSYRKPDSLEQEAMDKGYKFLGWQVHGEPLEACMSLGCNKHGATNGWRDKSNNPRGSDNTYVCDTHRIFWKIDMSD